MVSCGSGVSWGSNGEKVALPHSLSEVTAAVSGGWGDPWMTARTRRETLRRNFVQIRYRDGRDRHGRG